MGDQDWRASPDSLTKKYQKLFVASVIDRQKRGSKYVRFFSSEKKVENLKVDTYSKSEFPVLHFKNLALAHRKVTESCGESGACKTFAAHRTLATYCI